MTHMQHAIRSKPLACTVFITSFCLQTIMSSVHNSLVCSWNGVCTPGWRNREKEKILPLWLGSECQCAVRRHSTWKLIKSEFPFCMFTCFPTHMLPSPYAPWHISVLAILTQALFTAYSMCTDNVTRSWLKNNSGHWLEIRGQCGSLR